MPEASASRVSHASYPSPVSRRTMLRIAALASSVVASIPIVYPWTRWGVGQTLQHPREHGLVRLEVDQAPGARQRRVVGAGPRAARSPETRGCSASRRRATRSPVPSPGLRSSRAAAAGNSGPAPDSAGRLRRRRTPRTALRRRHRSPPRRACDSGARKTGALRSSANLRWPPTSSIGAPGAVVCPSPCPKCSTSGQSCRSL